MNKRAFILGLASVLCYESVAAAPSSPQGLELRIDHVSPTGQITVSMHNTGKVPLRLWRGGSWDVAPWRILRISAVDGTLKTYYEDPTQVFSDSGVRFWEISPEKPRVDDLDLTNGFWFPERPRRTDESIWATGDTLIVIYDIAASAEAHKAGVWWGVVAAKTVVP